MSIKVQQIPLSITDYAGKTALDFLENKDSLSPFYPHWQNPAESLLELAKSKVHFAHRKLLVESLKRQYTEAGIDLEHSDNQAVKSNIELLLLEHTCSVTTGQQIHIFLGPVFVWYKILSVLDKARKASKILGTPVIPVFWLASEDHDLEEINHVQLYGQTYAWHTSQTGPVGRMNCDLLPELAHTLMERTQSDPEQQKFLSLCKSFYSKGLSFSQATRNIVHSLFRNEGLLILDADCTELKKVFIPILQNEIAEQKVWKEVTSQNNELKEKNYPIQVNPREINLFLFKNQQRLRIQKSSESDEYLFISGSEPEPLSAWLEKTEKNPESFSPNALLRPLYQEMILPNIAYICGGSELTYWMQLSGLFKNYNIDFPQLELRTHAIIFKEKVFAKLTDILPIENYFLSDEIFKQQLMQEKQAEILVIEQHIEKLEAEISHLKTRIESSFLARNISWKDYSEQSKHLEQLKKIIKSGIDSFFSQNDFLEAALRQKNKMFSGQKQERKTSIIEYYPVLENLKSLYTPDALDTHLPHWRKMNLLLIE